MVAVLIAAALSCLGAPACTERVLDARRMSDETTRLESTFETLSLLKVSEWSNRSNCESISYSRGTFASQPDVGTCGGGTAAAFDDEARRAWSTVGDAISGTGVAGTTVFLVQYDHTGLLRDVEFVLPASWLNRWSYVYHAVGEMPPGNYPTEYVHTEISERWYFRWEEWN